MRTCEAGRCVNMCCIHMQQEPRFAMVDWLDDHCWSPRREGIGRFALLNVLPPSNASERLGSDEQGHKHRSHTFPMQTARSWLLYR